LFTSEFGVFSVGLSVIVVRVEVRSYSVFIGSGGRRDQGSKHLCGFFIRFKWPSKGNHYCWCCVCMLYWDKKVVYLLNMDVEFTEGRV